MLTKKGRCVIISSIKDKYIGFPEKDLKRYYLTNYSYKKFDIDKILLLSRQGGANENIGTDKKQTK